MRPEYEAAVDAVRFGWSLWITFILPALLVWIPMWGYRHTPKALLPVGCSTLLLSFILFCGLVLFHGHRIQHAKEAHMETEEELADWSSDTWLMFAPLTAIPVGLAYSAANGFVSAMTIGLVTECFRQPTSQVETEATQSEPTAPNGAIASSDC